MRISIIPSDKTIVIDGEVRTGIDFIMDPQIHAIQWFHDQGDVEFVAMVQPDGQIHKPHNMTITSLEPYQSVIDAFYSHVESMPVSVTPDLFVETTPSQESEEMPRPPEWISSLQIRLQLNAWNQLTQVQSWISHTDMATQLQWFHAQVFLKTTPFVQSMAAYLQWTPEQLDEFYKLASEL